MRGLFFPLLGCKCSQGVSVYNMRMLILHQVERYNSTISTKNYSSEKEVTKKFTEKCVCSFELVHLSEGLHTKCIQMHFKRHLETLIEIKSNNFRDSFLPVKCGYRDEVRRSQRQQHWDSSSVVYR